MKNSTTNNIVALANRGLVSAFEAYVPEHVASAQYMEAHGKVRFDRDLGPERNVVRITARVKLDGSLEIQPWGGGAILDADQQELAELVQRAVEVA